MKNFKTGDSYSISKHEAGKMTVRILKEKREENKINPEFLKNFFLSF